MRRIFAAALGGLLLVGCSGDPDSQLRKGCANFFAVEEDIDVDEFCACVSEGVASIDEDEKRLLGRVMSQSNEEEFEEAINDIVRDGELSTSSAQLFVGSLKTCSVNSAY